jgi:hypothetical protein
LDLVDHVLPHFIAALDAEDVLRVARTLGDLVTGGDELAVFDEDA